MVSRCPERCLKCNIKPQTSRRPHNVIRSAATWLVLERCFWLSSAIRDKMKCVWVKGCVLCQRGTIEVRSWHVNQQTTHVVVHTINVNQSLWAAIQSQKQFHSFCTEKFFFLMCFNTNMNFSNQQKVNELTRINLFLPDGT